MLSGNGGPAGRGLSEELRAFVEQLPYERRSIVTFVGQAADSLPPGAAVLDVGAGDAPYRELFAHCDYRTVDWSGSVHEYAGDADIVARAEQLPLKDGAVDVVLMTQVLEHVANPAAALNEAARVLCSGGQIYLTVPFVWELHELPHDYWRFTPASLEQLLADAGFTEIRVNPRNDCFTTAAQLLRNLGSAMGRSPDGRDGERETAAHLLADLSTRVAALASLDVNGILPLGWAAYAQRA